MFFISIRENNDELKFTEKRVLMQYTNAKIYREMCTNANVY